MSVLDLVAREARRAGRVASAAGVVLPAVVALAMLSGGAMWLARGRWLALSPAVPFLVWGVAAAAAALIAHRVRTRLAARARPAAVARAIEDEQRLRRGQLTGLLEVAESGGVFAQRAAERIGDSLAAVAARPAPRHRRRFVRALALSLFALVQVLMLAAGSWSTRADGWQALLHPIDAWRGTLLPALEVVDAPRRLPRGAAARIAVAAVGRSEVRLQWRITGGGWRDTLLTVDSAGRALMHFASVDADLALVAADGRTLSDTAVVRVVDRPFVGDVTLRATYPAYLGRASERLAADAPLRIPAGTRLSLDGHSSEPLAAVALVAGGTRIALRSEGTSFTGAWTPARSEVWNWEAKGLRQEIADLPSALEIEVLEDSVPRVEILAPVGEVLVGMTDRVGVELLAQDDHALVGVWMRRWVVDAAGKATEPQDFPLSDVRESEWVGGAVQDLARLRLEPGATVHLVAVARDAAPGGAEAREGRSRMLVLRVPTASEERTAARDAGEAAVAAANAAARAQAQLAEKTETASRSRTDRNTGAQPNSAQGGEQPRDRNGMAYENAEQAREIAEQQRALQERVQGLEEAAREMEDRLRKAGALDTALARQLQDAQRLLREAMTPEMAEALAKLEGSTQQLDGERTRQSLSDLAAQQQRLREALEKSAQMLKRAALEGSMETLKDEAQELADQQREFADSAARAPTDAEKAQALANRTRDLSKAIESLKERLEQERANTGAQGAERASDEARRSEAALEEALKQAQAARAQPQTVTERQRAQAGAQQAAEQAAQVMQDAAQSLEKARSGQVSEWKGELTDALDRSVQEMLQLAKEQDALAEQAQRNPNDPNLRSQQAALQQGVQTAQQRLEEEGKKSALVSPRTQQMMDQAQQRVEQATREAAQAQRGQQSQAMQEAANSLRQAAAQLTRDRERAASAQSASGLPELMQQLQQLAQQQGQLNGQMQSLFPGGQSQQARQDALDQAGRSQARELARAQREVARQLDEVSDADPTGRAQELAREARLLAQALDQGAVDPATQARQERLFRRMLDAGRSLEQEQRDETQRRESRAARGIERFTPAGGPARGKDAERYTVPTWEELRGLSAEERRLVIEYFRRLNAERTP
ncbi:MAG: hypothetical protein JNL44_05570 [Gemmatimonadetes bacterium]|nr:hypothetical protein [Gemmatimonadota bacterium]